VSSSVHRDLALAIWAPPSPNTTWASSLPVGETLGTQIAAARGLRFRAVATLDWYGCATFRLRSAGLTIFLDAYIDRAPGAPGTGLTADDIDECDWIVVGHSHFDHLAGAERIMARTGATLIGSYESVRLMEAAGVPSDRMVCVAGGERVRLAPDVTVSVLPSQHSCVWSHTQMAQSGEVCIGDLGVTWQEQQERMAALLHHLSTALTPDAIQHLVASSVGQSPRGDGGALLYLFDTPEGSLLFQDTSGHWSGILDGLHLDVAILAAAGRGNIDGEPIQGSLADFVGRQVRALRPARLILSHHDDWLPGFSVPTDMAPLRAAIAAASPTTELLEPGYLAGTHLFAVS
jgi:L-ascorbate metabolism protein UlaG (beta-lactamase superfamily)